jgi:hypothetical protein
MLLDVGTLRILEAVRLLGLKVKQKYIRLLLQSFLARYRKYLKKKPPLFILAVPMVLQSFMPTG